LKTVRIAISGRFFYDIIPTETGLVPFGKYGNWGLEIGYWGIRYWLLGIGCGIRVEMQGLALLQQAIQTTQKCQIV